MVSDRTVLVRLKANVSDFQRGMMSARSSIRGLTEEIDTTNDRTAWLAQGILGLAPALVPLAGAAVPAVAALSTQMLVAGAAAGVAALAFNGVGDGLKELNEYQLDPSAENFAKLQLAMEKIGPAGEELVRFLDRVGPQFAQLGMTAREGMFGGVQGGITEFMQLLPQLNRIIGEIATGMGELAQASGEALAGDRFAAFFDYLESDARPILLEMGRTIGGFAEGLANLLVSFGPLTMGFSRGFADMAESFAQWSRGLDSNESFQGFLQYVQEVGPMALQFLGQLATTFSQLVQAAAPVGEVLLPLFTNFLEIIGLIAASPIGPAFVAAGAAIGLYGRAAALASITGGGLFKVLGKTAIGGDQVRKSLTTARPSLRQFGLAAASAVYSNQQLVKSMGSTSNAAAIGASRMYDARQAVTGFARSVAPAAGSAALLGLAMTGVAEKTGLSNTVMLALAGSMAGPWGTAIGGAIGAVIDFNAVGDDMEATLDGINAALRAGDWDTAAAGAKSLKSQLDDLNKSTGVKDFISDGFAQLKGRLSGDLVDDNFWKGTVKLSPERMREQNRARQQGEQTRGYAGRELQGEATAAAARAAAGGYRLTAQAARELTMSQRELTAAANAANAALNREAGIDQYTTSLLDARDAIAANGQTLDRNTRSGLANRAALRGIATDATGAAEGMKNFDRRTKFLDRARRDFIETAVSAGATRAEARRLATQFGLIDRIRVKPKVQEQGSKESRARVKAMRDEIARIRSKMVRMDEKGAAAARARIASLKAQIDALRDKSVTITTNRVERITQLRASGRFVGGQAIAADGATVVGAPRLPYGDKVLYAVAPGEEIISNRYGQADKNRDLLKAINDGVDLRHYFPGYADGGTAAGRAARVSVAAPRVSVGGASVRVIIDGREVRAIVDERFADRDDMQGMRGRAGG